MKCGATYCPKKGGDWHHTCGRKKWHLGSHRCWCRMNDYTEWQNDSWWAYPPYRAVVNALKWLSVLYVLIDLLFLR